MTFYPPDGEFAVTNYRITGDFRVPFRIMPFVDMQTSHKLELTIKVRAEIPEANYGGNVQVTCVLPKTTATASTEIVTSTIQGQTAEYIDADHKLIWTLKKLQGGAEATIMCRATLSSPAASLQNMKKEVGPVSLTFEVPMYNVSNLQVRYLRINEKQQKTFNPCRWVRYVTQSSSYVCRF